jgi:UDP-2,3-diacylglucosamine hydrolase
MIFLFSDIHLRDESHPWEQSFLATLKSCLENNATTKIILLGDILDTCSGGTHPWEKIYPTFFSLIHNTTIPILYIEGNHDFHLKRLLNRPHINHVVKEITLTIGNKQFYLAHGDTLDASLGYRFIHGVLRSFIIKWVSYKLPFRWVVKIARSLSRYSRSSNLQTIQHHHNLREHVYSFVREKWNSGFDGVMLGHSHSLEHMGNETQIYLNCGFWPRDRSFFEISPHPWSIKKRIVR